MLVSLGEGGEAAFGTNINYFTEEFGIACNSDAVVRTVYYKYLHPKEVHVGNGVLNRGINVAAGKRPTPATGASAAAIAESSRSNLAFAYPYGERRRRRRRHRHSGAPLPLPPRRLPRRRPPACVSATGPVHRPHTPPAASRCLPPLPPTPPHLPPPTLFSTHPPPPGASLNVAKPAFPVLSSGHIAYPLNRPLCALWSSAPHGNGRPPAHAPPSGKLCVLGSSYLFHDDWCAAPTPAPLAPFLRQIQIGCEASVGGSPSLPPALPRSPPCLDEQRRSSVSAAPPPPPLLPRTHAVLRPCRAVPHRAVPCPPAHPPGWTRTRTRSWSTCCSSG